MSEQEQLAHKQTPITAAITHLRSVQKWLVATAASAVVLIAGSVALLGAYQVQTYTHRLNIGSPEDAIYLSRFHPPEQNERLNYRWSRRESFVALNYPSAPFEITFRASAYRPDDRPVELLLSINGKDVRRFALDSEPREYVLRSRLIVLSPEGVELSFQPLNVFTDEKQRELGVALDWIEIRQAASRYGPVIPPLFVMGWWLLVAALPLGLAPWLRLPFRLGLALSAATFAGLSFLYLWAEPSRWLREHWPQGGALLVLAQVVVLVAATLVIRRPALGLLRQRPQPKRPWRLALPIWLAVGLGLFYLVTASGRLTSQAELQGMAAAATLVWQQPAAPLDRLLPEPPDGYSNPRYLNEGLIHTLLAAPFYQLGQRVARAMPFLPAPGVGSPGVIVAFLLLVNAGLGAALALALYWVVRLLGYGPRIALLLGLLLGVGTSSWLFARTFSNESFNALGLLLAVGSSLAYRSKLGSNEQKNRGWLAFNGLWLGLLIANEPPLVVILPVFALYLYRPYLTALKIPLLAKKIALPATTPDLSLLTTSAIGSKSSFRPTPSAAEAEPTFRPGEEPASVGVKQKWHEAMKKERRKSVGLLLAWLGPLLVGPGVLGWYNWLRYGAIFGSVQEAKNQTPLWESLYQILVSPGTGVVFANPVVLLAFAGLGAFWAAHGSTARLIGAISLIYIGIVALRYQSPIPGEPIFAALLPVLPLWLLLVAPLVERILSPQTVQQPRRIRFELVALMGLGLLSLATQCNTLLSSSSSALAFDFYRETTLARFMLNAQLTCGLLLIAWLVLAVAKSRKPGTS